MQPISERIKHLNDFEIQQAFYEACSKNSIDDLNYLITSEYGKKIDISKQEYLGFRSACLFGSLDVVRYLLTNPKINPPIDIHIKNDSAFKGAAQMGRIEIIEYLIIEANIKKTDHIKKYLSKNPNKMIENIFHTRELNKQLSFNFEEQPTSKPKI